MASDFSRQRFDPGKDFCAVLMQQGRVHLDAEWNELVELLDRRLRAQTIDTIGRAVVPRETADAFKIDSDFRGSVTIGAGRMYVDGLLAENHGVNPDLDPILGERNGGGVIPYIDQPYFRTGLPVKLPEGNLGHLFFLEVWQREITSLEDSALLEPAVAVETASRLQTVWRVRVLENLPADVTCEKGLTEHETWKAITRPSDGRLSTRAVGVDDDDDPCILPPAGGYRGVENRLYRVQIHNGGSATAGGATFKWSRDNASVCTAVTSVQGAKLTVETVSLDEARSFNFEDWVELTDDIRELAGQPGALFKIAGVEEATSEITLGGTIPADLIPSGAGSDTCATRHTRLIRWDQSGRVKDDAGAVILDLNAGSTGAIPVPSAGNSILIPAWRTCRLSFSPRIQNRSARRSSATGKAWTPIPSATGLHTRRLQKPMC